MISNNFQDELIYNIGLLRFFANSLTKNNQSAEDLIQETTLKALKNKHRFIPNSNMKAWLSTIMRNLFINDYRKRMVRSTIYDRTLENHYINSGNITVSNDGESNVYTEELYNIINQLEDDFKIPFLLYFQGYSYEEIRQELQIPLGTLKSRIFYARKTLKERINKLNKV